MEYIVLIALLAFCATASAVDSEGTNFVYAFVRNANPDITNQLLSVTVINRNALNCKFTMTYRPDFHKATPAENITITVLSKNAQELEVPSWYGWNYAGQAVQDDTYLTLMAYSTCPITLLANNYDNVTKQGDTYLVLPATWGSRSFTFSLPPAVTSSDSHHYEQVFVLPTTDGTAQVVFEEIGNAQSIYYFNATYGNAPAVYVGTNTPDKRPRTYHVLSDKPVLIVAGVTCAGADSNSCDHIAYMPHPPPTDACYTFDYYDDDHVSYLPTTSQFFTDIPGSCLTNQNITRTLNDGTTRTIAIKPKMESPLWTVTTTNANQLGVAFHNGGSNIHIARYYDGTYYNTRGAFIATSPSITQFHNDYSAFYTRNPNDTVEIYCTVLTCAALTLDGASVYNASAPPKVIQKVDGVSYYIFVTTLANPGFHQLDLDPGKGGNYGFFVFGKNGQYSYGYEGGVNKPTFVLAPQTTVTPFTGPTTTVTTVSTPAITTPTAGPATTTTAKTAPPSSTATPTTVTPVTSKQTTVITTGTLPVTTPNPTSPTIMTSSTLVTASTSTKSTTVATSVTTPTPAGTTPTTPTTQTPVVTTSSTASPQTTTVAPTASTKTTSVVTTPSTQTPLVTSPTTPTPKAPTSATTVVTPVIVTTASPSTVGPSQSTASTPTTLTTPSTATVPIVTTPTNPPVTTPTTPVVTTPTTPTTTRPVTQPVTTPTIPVVATTQSSSAVPVTSSTARQTTPTVKTTKTTTTTTTTTTTIAPSTTTSSSSVISLVVPAVLTIFIALFI